MSAIQITRRSVHRAILSAFDRLAITNSKEPLHVDTIAAELHCSRSTLQRRLDALGTTYTIELHRMQALVAVRALLRGDTVAAAAHAVGLTPDHLSRLIHHQYGILPGHIARCHQISVTLACWKERPAGAGSRLYRQRLGKWPRLRSELQRRLRGLPHDSLLRPWADQVLAASQRPDFRGREYRQRAQARQHADQADFDRWVSEHLFREPRPNGEQPPISAPPPSGET